MNKEITKHGFSHEMSDNKDHGFSYGGAGMLYDYIESCIEDDGFIFDAIALV